MATIALTILESMTMLMFIVLVLRLMMNFLARQDCHVASCSSKG
nr:MAG TPA: hypothetical protein [Caudoviricetes sp.]